MTVPVLIYGIDVEQILASARTQPVGSQKLAYSQAVANALGPNPWIQVWSNNQMYYEARSGVTLLSATAAGIRLPNWFSEPPNVNLVNALTHSTTVLIVRNATALSTYLSIPLNVNGGGSPDIALSISKELNGSWYVRTNNAVVLAPPLDLDVGTGDPSDWTPRISLNQLMNDMKLDSLVQPRYGTSGNAQAETAGGSYDIVKCLIDRGPPLPVKSYDYMDEILPWFWPYAGPGHVDGLGLRLQYGHGIISVKRRSNGQWVDAIRNVEFDGYTFYGNSWQPTMYSTTGDYRRHGDSTVSSQLPGNAGPELWISPVRDRALVADSRSIAVICMCRIITDNNQPYYGTQGHYAIHIGFDIWGRSAPIASNYQSGGGGTTGWPSSNNYWCRQINGSNSRWISCRNGDWTPCALISMDRERVQRWNAHGWVTDPLASDIPCLHSPTADLESQIRANPPNWTY